MSSPLPSLPFAAKVVCVSTGRAGFVGIIRGKVIALCAAHGIPLACGDHVPTALAGAEEAFVTGTFGGLTGPVRAIDGRRLAAVPGPLTARLGALYAALIDADSV